MAWIESHQSLLHHKKTNRAIALLKVNRYKFLGHMHSLWWWALDNAPSGYLDDLLPAEIADAAGWDVTKGDEFVTALVTVGFIDEVEDDGLMLHDWTDYAGRLAEMKRARSEAGREGGRKSGEARRKKREANGEAKNEAVRVLVEAKGALLEAPTNLPNLTKPTNLTNPLDIVAADFAAFGKVTAGTPQSIKYSVKDYGQEWVEMAVRKAAASGADDNPPWNYVESILERWKANGGPDEPRATDPRPDNRGQRGGGDGGAAQANADAGAAWALYGKSPTQYVISGPAGYGEDGEHPPAHQVGLEDGRGVPDQGGPQEASDLRRAVLPAGGHPVP